MNMDSNFWENVASKRKDNNNNLQKHWQHDSMHREIETMIIQSWLLTSSFRD